MTESNKKRGAANRSTEPAESSRKKPSFKVIPGTQEGESTQRKPAKIRVVGLDERLTPDERKQRFGRNLDMLIRLVGRTRKEVADEIGIKHKLILRLVSAGISRPDERNVENLTRIAAYFALLNVDDLWRADLLQVILPAGGSSGFVETFGPRLLAERERRLAEDRAVSHDEVAYLSSALGFESVSPPLTGPWAVKVAMILASPKADQFKRLIDDYHQLALATKPVERQHERV